MTGKGRFSVEEYRFYLCILIVGGMRKITFCLESKLGDYYITDIYL